MPSFDYQSLLDSTLDTFDSFMTAKINVFWWQVILTFLAFWLGLGLISTIWHYLTIPGLKMKSNHYLITGASQGLGLETAKLLFAGGATLSLVSRSQQKLAAAVQEIDPQGNSGRVHIYPCDVTNFQTTTTTVNQIYSDHGPIDVLLCIAGSSRPGLIVDTPLSDFEHQVKLNYIANINLTKAVLPNMISRDSGRIAYVSSVLGLCTTPGYGAYSPSKHALLAFADTLRSELSSTNILIQCFLPGTIDTPGLVEENLRKPKVTQVIEADDPILSPQVVASVFISFLKNGHFMNSDRFLTGLLVDSSRGLKKKTNPIFDVFLSPFYSFFQFIYTWILDSAVREHVQYNK